MPIFMREGSSTAWVSFGGGGRITLDLKKNSQNLSPPQKKTHNTGAEQRLPLVPWLPPLALVDVRSGAAEEFGGGGGSSRSVSNRAEAAAVVRLVARLRAAGVAARSIGVICFFRAQAELVRRLLLENRMHWQQQQQQEKTKEVEGEENKEENDDDDEIQVATVDSFQGCEKDLVVITTAATRPSAFTRDAHRVNVAITRARRHLVVVGHGGALVAVASAAGGGAGGAGGGAQTNALGAIVRACSSNGGVLEMV